MWTEGAAISTMTDMARTSVLFLLATTTLLVQPAYAQARASHEHCFELVGRESGIAPDLLRAVAHVESSNTPTATNKQHVARTGSYDIGLMQINSRWLGTLKRFGIGEAELFDACTSIEVGAWILSDLFKRHGNSWEAVGAYNAACTSLKGDACRAARDSYIAKVKRAMSRSASVIPVRNSTESSKASTSGKPPAIQTVSFSD